MASLRLLSRCSQLVYGAIALADCAIGRLDIGEHRLGELILFATLQE